MDLFPNADEEQIIDMARGVLSKSLSATRLHAEDQGLFSPAIARSLAELGWFGMALPEADGGSGFNAIDQTLLFRELGRELGPVAVLPMCLAAAIASADGKREIAAAVVSGEALVALAVRDPNRSQARLFEVEQVRYVVAFSGDEARLLDAGALAIERQPCLDKSVAMGMADLSVAPILARTPAEPVDRLGCLLTAAMLVGICEAMTEMITEYAKIRETFGRPIGSYQAVRHPIADMAVRTFAARCQLFLAAVSIRDDRADASLQTYAAKCLANEAAIRNADANLQLHGGISTTDEHDAHLFMKRAHLLSDLFGNRSLPDRIAALARAA